MHPVFASPPAHMEGESGVTPGTVKGAKHIDDGATPTKKNLEYTAQDYMARIKGSSQK
eukprot:CAMPEP_0173404104 /NCGR_PEP_ID=MMETSP1356-20130122/58525_1 /TAXON_ID=77927 ORGANISM="Hemiselmis virescens, Strain PCC157" /NCGR_SAMPLE_ID=MMETSP1356 /ASSEMBLY_ACC=CAM_ASM_000847 /LENGTH=57 /DNA_ID=CAMNT_0014364725 /DNA_START=12 /DNA_END=185 /DNA_ORIENTATION=+